jgi:hypothetical protein
MENEEQIDQDEQQGEIAAAYREAAREKCSDGELEVDEGAVVSFGGDKGAYVAAWIWVSYEDAGIKECDSCERTELNPPDEAGWVETSDFKTLCPECAEEDEDEKEEVKE